MRNCHRIDRIIERRTDIGEWLENDAPFASTEQSHLDAGTAAQAYWHHGYHAALDDILALLERREPEPESCTCDDHRNN